MGFSMAQAALTLALLLVMAVEDIRVDLDRRDDARVRCRLDASGFAVYVDVSGNLQKLEPTTIRLETQQTGRWTEPRVDAGRYLKPDFDPDKQQVVRIE